MEDAISLAGSDLPTISCISKPSLLEELEIQEPELSEDEGLPPDQPAFTGLFPPSSLQVTAVQGGKYGSAWDCYSST